MVLIEDILIDLGFEELDRFMDERVFRFETDKIIVKLTHLSMIPQFLLNSGFSVQSVYKSNRIIQFEPSYIPDSAETFEQALAFLVFGLQVKEYDFSSNEVPWFKMGLGYKCYLPWEIEKKRQIEKYESMPRISIERAWLKILIQQLKQWKDFIVADEEISLTFNGEFLIFRFGSSSIPIPATGKKWDHIYYLKPQALESLPKRIYKSQAYFFIDDMELKLSGVRLPIDRKVESR